MLEKLLERLMPALNEYTLSYITSDGKPPEWWADAWPDLEQDLRSKLRTKLGVAEDPELKALHQRRLREWPTKGGSSRSWRSCVLYAVSPAETAPDRRASLVLVLLNLLPVAEICNWVQLLTFMLIDKNDEYRTRPRDQTLILDDAVCHRLAKRVFRRSVVQSSCASSSSTEPTIFSSTDCGHCCKL